MIGVQSALRLCHFCGAWEGSPHTEECPRDEFTASKLESCVKTPLWMHQKEAFNFAFPKRGVLLAMDMGTGKSLTTIALILSRKHQRVLIQCPLSVVNVWPREFGKHAETPVVVESLNSGTVKDKQKLAAQAVERATTLGRPCVIVINYESAWREPFGNWAMRAGFDCLVADESHRIKAPGGKASLYCGRLGKVIPYRILLTGTPFPHSPLDAYGQYRAMDTSIFGWSYTAFRAKYAIMGGYEGHQVLGFRDLDDLHKRFYSAAFRVKKEEVLSLPEVMHETRHVELCPKARRVYQELERDFCADVGKGIITAANALVRLVRLQQLTSGYGVTEDGDIAQIDSGKQEALADLLEDLPADEPVCVFARFTHDLRVIQETATSAGRKYFEVSGEKKELDSWQTDSGGSVLGLQTQAGGLGIDATRARYCVYYSHSLSLGDYEQSLARVHRPGQTRNVVYYSLVASKTVDETIVGSLRDKKEVIESVLSKAKQEKAL